MVLVAQGIGVFGEGQAAVLIAVRCNLQRLEHCFGHEVGAASRTSRADAAAFYLVDIGDPGAFQCNHLKQVGIHDGHGQNVMLLPFELAQTVEAGHGHIAHHLADDRFALVGQLDVFHAGAGDFGHRFYTFDILGPDFGHTAAVGIVNSAGTAGADADERGFGQGGRSHEPGDENKQYCNACAFHIKGLLYAFPSYPSNFKKNDAIRRYWFMVLTINTIDLGPQSIPLTG
jgi:hypothetical protein